MLKKSVKLKVLDLLSKKFEEEEFASLFLVDVTSNEKSEFIRIYIDGDQGVRFSDCQQISRYLESFLDEDPGVGDSYTLEVSSPGVKRPLDNMRQFPQHTGRTFKVRWLDDKLSELKLVDVQGECLIFETIISKKKKSKNKTQERVETDLTKIKEAVVKLSFNK